MPSPLLPYHRVASIRQSRGNSRCQSELRHNRSPLIPVLSTLTCLPHIHPPIIQDSLYFNHPPKPRPPSSTSPINFRIHYLFQQLFIIHPVHIIHPLHRDSWPFDILRVLFKTSTIPYHNHGDIVYLRQYIQFLDC